MEETRSQQRYNELFPDDKSKAQAFDKLAAAYFYTNFGQMQKADLETLMFSLYLDRILDESEEDLHSYSDYTLSKLLGITQSKVSNLKVRKELLYPYERFNWRESFKRVVHQARYEDGKIKIPIPDKNLFLEIKNAIEVSGGYYETQLNPSLLQVRPEYFVDLMVAASDGDGQRDEITNKLKDNLRKRGMENDKISEAINRKSINELLKEQSVFVLADIFEECIPVAGKIVGNLIRETVSKSAESRKS